MSNRKADVYSVTVCVAEQIPFALQLHTEHPFAKGVGHCCFGGGFAVDALTVSCERRPRVDFEIVSV